MSIIRSNSVRSASIAGLLLALGLLAGCESNSAVPEESSPGESSTGQTASTGGTPPLIPGSPTTFASQLQGAGDRVRFAVDRYDLSPEAEATLRNQAMLLQAYPAVTVTIEGHADERGTREYNLALADRRADAVRNYLTALGISSERVETVSFGKERPDCADASEPCWAANRRGVTVVNQ